MRFDRKFMGYLAIGLAFAALLLAAFGPISASAQTATIGIRTLNAIDPTQLRNPEGTNSINDHEFVYKGLDQYMVDWHGAGRFEAGTDLKQTNIMNHIEVSAADAAIFPMGLRWEHGVLSATAPIQFNGKQGPRLMAGSRIGPISIEDRPLTPYQLENDYNNLAQLTSYFDEATLTSTVWWIIPQRSGQKLIIDVVNVNIAELEPFATILQEYPRIPLVEPDIRTAQLTKGDKLQVLSTEWVWDQLTPEKPTTWKYMVSRWAGAKLRNATTGQVFTDKDQFTVSFRTSVNLRGEPEELEFRNPRPVDLDHIFQYEETINGVIVLKHVNQVTPDGPDNNYGNVGIPGTPYVRTSIDLKSS